MAEIKIAVKDQECQVENCREKQHAKGLCSKHYRQIQRTGRIKDRVKRSAICTVEGCNRKHKGHGLCSMHLRQVKDYGEIRARTIFTPNIFTVEGNICRIVLFDNKGERVGITIIDTEDYGKCKNHKWHLNANGYAASVINNKNITLHQYVYPTKRNDHKDTDKLNNRKSNLRECSKSQNAKNVKIHRHNTSGIKNVYWRRDIKKWAVGITANKIKYHIGFFDTITKAEIAAIKARKELHGNFAHNG